MHLNAKLDQESSRIANKVIFSCETDLTHQDIIDLKERKLISYVEESTLPESIPCQVLIFIEPPTKAKVVFFNNDFVLPKEAEDEPFLNKMLLERCLAHGGFWMECMVPIYDPLIKIDFSFNIGE